ncbi:MAG: hypothetical protein IKH89_05965 [Bacteroidales bacterium]|nr:hypothetical protein [Bacteroidales bacterium]MBR6972274.1 hypothetical protein [Bacteroidales bacterium]
MKTFVHIITGLGAAMLFLVLLSCSKADQPNIDNGPDKEQEQPKVEDPMPNQIKITISGKTLPIKIENNAATKALVNILRSSSITFTANDYGGFEKVGNLGRSLPSSNSQITAQPGDVILYSGNSIVLFYGSNSWSYTRIGRMQYSSLDELKSFLKAGGGDVSVTLSL